MNLARFLVILFAAMLTGGLCGCVFCGQVHYPGSGSVSPPSDITVLVNDRNELSVSIASRTRDASRVEILQDETMLTDERGRQFRLEFRPNEYANDYSTNQFLPGTDGRNPPLRSASALSYHVRARGPLPAASEHSFSSGKYTISVAYTEDGERRSAQTTFVLKWRPVSFLELFFWE